MPEIDNRFPPRFSVGGWDWRGFTLQPDQLLQVFVRLPVLKARHEEFMVMSVAEHEERVKRLESCLEELRDAVCTAVNWELLADSKVGDCPWISSSEAEDVRYALKAVNQVFEEKSCVTKD